MIDPSLDHIENTESRMLIRGNPQIDFARKRQVIVQKLANLITLPTAINQPAQQPANSSRATF
jgi:hypothetical protein